MRSEKVDALCGVAFPTQKSETVVKVWKWKNDNQTQHVRQVKQVQ